LTKQGIKNVKIVGGSGDRMKLIQEFKNNDDVEVLIATSQTLSTGVTLTEANQMFFFGTPWRSADYNQCCDRIYRIGQTTDVDIYNVLLNTGSEPNLSTRMNDILNWSDNMFNNMIEGESGNERL
jgi:SNF2 family DNA or RNA helicase